MNDLNPVALAEMVALRRERDEARAALARAEALFHERCREARTEVANARAAALEEAAQWCFDRAAEHFTLANEQHGKVEGIAQAGGHAAMLGAGEQFRALASTPSTMVCVERAKLEEVRELVARGWTSNLQLCQRTGALAILDAALGKP